MKNVGLNRVDRIDRKIGWDGRLGSLKYTEVNWLECVESLKI